MLKSPRGDWPKSGTFCDCKSTPQQARNHAIDGTVFVGPLSNATRNRIEKWIAMLYYMFFMASVNEHCILAMVSLMEINFKVSGI